MLHCLGGMTREKPLYILTTDTSHSPTFLSHSWLSPQVQDPLYVEQAKAGLASGPYTIPAITGLHEEILCSLKAMHVTQSILKRKETLDL